MNTKLNTLLADLTVVSRKLQNFHWYVRGKYFFVTHQKLDEYYHFVNGAIDEVAEQILMIGESPVASLKESLDLSAIEESLGEHRKTKEIYTLVLADFIYLLNLIIKIKKEAEEKEHFSVSILMDGYISELTKDIWMIRQVLDNKKTCDIEEKEKLGGKEL